MDNEKFLSFKGVVLTTADREILEGPYCLNDQIIEFYFRYLTFIYGEEDIILMSPSVSFWLANCASRDEIRHTVESLKLHQKQLVFFTINNQEISEDGNHWSLLFYIRKLNTFVHYDSFKGVNRSNAQILYRAVKDFVNKDFHNDSDLSRPLPSILRRPKLEIAKSKGRSRNYRQRLKEGDATPFRELVTPQQSNLYDCGLYVMKIAAVICEWYWCAKLDTESVLWFDAMDKQVTQSYVEKDMRFDILEFMDLLKEEDLLEEEGCDQCS